MQARHGGTFILAVLGSGLALVTVAVGFAPAAAGATGPRFTSAAHHTFTIDRAGSVTITTAGFAHPAHVRLAETGALPLGLTFTDNRNGTATLAGTPSPNNAVRFPLTVTASTSARKITQNFVATVRDVPGYVVANSVGTVTTFGGLPNHGSVASAPASPIVGIAETADGRGYVLSTSQGTVYSFGHAPAGTSLPTLSNPIVGVAMSPNDNGYWLVGSHGAVYAFGAVAFHGDLAGANLTSSIVGIASTRDGGGYYLVSSAGSVFAFGDAQFKGSITTAISSPIAGIALDRAKQGYWLVAKNGTVYRFGAPYFGDGSNLPGAATVGMTPSPDDAGYLLIRSGGGVSKFGDARSGGTVSTTNPIVGISHP